MKRLAEWWGCQKHKSFENGTTGNSTINRTSLMSTGSSEEGTSSGSASSGESSHISSYNDQGIEVSSCTNSTTGEFNDIMQDLSFQ